MENLEWYEAEKKAKRKIFMEYHYDNLLETPEKMLFGVPKREHTKFIGYIRKRGRARYKYGFYTINFNDKTSIDDAVKKMEKICKKKWIENYLYCYEVRNEEFKGMHVHLVCELNEDKNPYDTGREIYNTVKHHVGGRKHVDNKYANDATNFVNYIKGLKKEDPRMDSMKSKTVEFSKMWRKENDLKDYYGGL